MFSKFTLFTWTFTILMAVLLSATTTLGEFPNDPKPCRYGDTTCIQSVIGYMLTKKYAGEPSMNMPTMDPFFIKEIHIKQSGLNPVKIDLKFTNITVVGLKDTVVLKVKGFDRDLTQKHEVHLRVNINLLSDYNIKGNILILPINGHGRSNVTLINTNVEISFEGEPVSRNDTIYMKTKHLRINIVPEGGIFNFENLFNGDKALGDNMNLFLNENWRDIFNELHGQLSRSFSKEYAGVINSVFKHLPYDKYFLN